MRLQVDDVTRPEGKVLLVGAGLMATQHFKVLHAMGIPTTVLGRGRKSAQEFERQTGVSVLVGGIDRWTPPPGEHFAKAVVCVNDDQLAKAAQCVLRLGIPSVLLEKPGGLSGTEVSSVARLARRRGAQVFVAYNRRFFASTLKAQEIIAADGGITSFLFEFTEWSHIVGPLKTGSAVKRVWMLANSTHVVDLAFSLAGPPRKMICYKDGRLSWHPAGAIYCGAGITEAGVLFSYHANWSAPGRWGLEVLTRAHRLIFRPLERLAVQEIGSTAINDTPLDDSLDQEFKPGLYRQMASFLGCGAGLQTIDNQLKMMRSYLKMSGERTK